MSDQDWIGPNGLASCPQCDGFGCLDDENDTQCPTCNGDGVATIEDANAYVRLG